MRADHFSLWKLMSLVTGAVVFAWLMQLSVRGSWVATVFASAMMIIALPFALYILAFMVVYPFGMLNEFIEKQSVVPQSPFANDRLPERMVELPPDAEQAH